jgi:DNA-binding beta-propeller fold protein YncE
MSVTIALPLDAYQVRTLAGTDKEDEDAILARFNYFRGVAVDSDGNVLVADTENHRIRRITPQGQVSTLAGTGEAGHRDGNAAEAQFNDPWGVAVDKDGNVLVADTDNHRIRRITPQGQVSTLAGTGEVGYRNGKAGEAHFVQPINVAVDGYGNVLVTEYSHCIRVITPQGQVGTLAGSGHLGVLRSRGYRDGPVGEAQFSRPWGMAVDKNGNVLVADPGNHCIRRITPLGQVSTLAGSGREGYRDGAAGEAQFNFPIGVAVDKDGSVLVADGNNYCVRVITVEGRVGTLAGSGKEGHRDGHAAEAQFFGLRGVAVDKGSGSVVVVDRQSVRVVVRQARVAIDSVVRIVTLLQRLIPAHKERH